MESTTVRDLFKQLEEAEKKIITEHQNKLANITKLKDTIKQIKDTENNTIDLERRGSKDEMFGINYISPELLKDQDYCDRLLEELGYIINKEQLSFSQQSDYNAKDLMKEIDKLKISISYEREMIRKGMEELPAKDIVSKAKEDAVQRVLQEEGFDKKKLYDDMSNNYYKGESIKDRIEKLKNEQPKIGDYLFQPNKQLSNYFKDRYLNGVKIKVLEKRYKEAVSLQKEYMEKKARIMAIEKSKQPEIKQYTKNILSDSNDSKTEKFNKYKDIYSFLKKHQENLDDIKKNCNKMDTTQTITKDESAYLQTLKKTVDWSEKIVITSPEIQEKLGKEFTQLKNKLIDLDPTKQNVKSGLNSIDR